MSDSSKPSIARRDSRMSVDAMLKDAFNRVDQDQDGIVNHFDIDKALRSAGCRFSTDEMATLMHRIDPHNNGKVTFEDFKALHEAFIDRTFHDFDPSNRGYVDDQGLQEGLRQLGVQVTLEEAQSMLQQLQKSDENQQLRLRPDEFKDLYLILRAKMLSFPNLEYLLWDPNVRELSKHWWKASVEIGEGGLRAPLPEDKPLVSPAPQNDATKVSPTVKFFGGALSGVVEALILTPLDVTKTRLQLDKIKQYNGMLDCGKKLFKAEGPKGLYKGFTPWTIHVVTKNGTRFYFNAIYRKLLADKHGQVSGSKEFVAGAMAGATEAVLIVTPFEVVKTRLQGQNIVAGEVPKYRGPIHTTATIIKQEGVTALWKGVSPTIFRQGLNQACSFWSNTFVKRYVWKVQDGDHLPAWKSVLTGMMGGVPGPCINCPMDVVKTRLMAQETIAGQAPKYSGMVNALTTIPKEEGVLALYKGLGPRLMRLCPSYGIQWLVMDQVSAYFARK